jgi:LuxR family maltose regulon positive regulatory protein
MADQPLHGSLQRGVASEEGLIERHIERQRLLTLIDYPTVAPVTLITAPAGFGKTTLAAQWAAQTPRQTAWLSLRGESNNSDRFLRDLLASLNQFDGPEHRAADGAPTLEHVLAAAQQAVLSGPAALVMDDYHIIESDDIVRLTEFLIQELPRTFALIINSREQPPLFLGRLRLNGLVRDITETDLRFEQSEVQELVQTASPVDLSETQVQLLTDRTEGWIAGIRLALLAAQNRDPQENEDLVSSFSAHQWLDEYVAEEVISRLPDDLGDFVLRTSSLDSLEPELCDAVLQIRSSAALIEELRRKLLFLRRDQRADGPLRYHALFAECVARVAVRRLSTEVIQGLHKRAGAWLESQGRVETAIEQYLQGSNRSAAVRLTSELCLASLAEGQFGAMLYWLSKLPREAILADPDLVYWNVRALLSVGRVREGKALQFEAEPAWQASQEPLQLAYAAFTRSLVQDAEGGISTPLYLSYQALHWFPADRYIDRHYVWAAIAFDEFLRGNDDLMHEAYRQAEQNLVRLPGAQRRWSVFVAGERAHVYATRGNLAAAERLLTHTMSQLSAEFRDEEVKLRYRRAAIYLEWNQLEQARDEVEQVLTDLERFPPTYWWAEGLFVAVRVFWASGERDRATAILQHILEVTETSGRGVFWAGAQALQASHWIQTGQLELARDWNAFRLEMGNQWPRDFGEADLISPHIQLLVAEGAFTEASAIARQRIEEGQNIKRWAAIIPLYLWDFVAQMQLGDESAALEALRAALHIGTEGGFVRSFAPPGVDINPLLLGIIPRLPEEEAAHLREIIRRLAPDAAIPFALSSDGALSAAAGFMLAPGTADSNALLSRREEQVITLLSQGSSNRQVAEVLFISENTVKKHISNIFAKLGVSNRTAAILRARDMGILE